MVTVERRPVVEPTTRSPTTSGPSGVGPATGFRFAFANAVPEAEAPTLYETYHVAGSGAPIASSSATSRCCRCSR